MLNNILDTSQKKLAKNEQIVRILLKIRNQCNIVISHFLGSSSNIYANGEYLLLNSIIQNLDFVNNRYVFFDVGANKGDYTELILKLIDSNSIIYSIEPDPKLIENLKSKFSRNNIVIENCALSDLEGVCEFYLNNVSDQLNSLVPYRDSKTQYNQSIQVKVHTIDSFVNKHQIDKIDFLKIDVEGFDFHVIKGARKLLEKGGISIIQFEYGDK